MSQKTYFVAWERKDSLTDLDDCALQGPHSKDDAERVKNEIHAYGCKATVIDCTELFKSIARNGVQ